MESIPLAVVFAVLLVAVAHQCEGGIGVNYGRMADNLPPPSQVASFLQQNTIIDKVKLFDADPTVLQAFANSGIGVVVTLGNGDIPTLARQLPAAQEWVRKNIAPFVPATQIRAICVGNEIVATADKSLIAQMLPAMQNLHTALAGVGLDKQVKVSTPHSLGILAASEPPSTGRFRRGFDRVIFRPLLSFLRSTGSPFMVNPYPYFGFTDRTLSYALFQPNSGVYDNATGITYYNMFVAQLDAVYSAMKKLGFGDVEIAVAETGWPAQGDPGQNAISVDNARSYNGNLIKWLLSGSGTPLMPNRTFDTYIFSLFNEDLKPGPTAERHFGLFNPDFSAVYDVGVMTTQAGDSAPTSSPANPAPAPATTTTNKKWCVAKPDANPSVLQSNIDYACGQGIDCSPIQAGGACFDPNTIISHATYAMNAYFQAAGRNPYNCDFAQTGLLTDNDPSYGNCVLNAV